MTPLAWSYLAVWSVTAAWVLFALFYDDDFLGRDWLVEKSTAAGLGILIAAGVTLFIYLVWGWPSWSV